MKTNKILLMLLIGIVLLSGCDGTREYTEYFEIDNQGNLVDNMKECIDAANIEYANRIGRPNEYGNTVISLTYVFEGIECNEEECLCW